VTSSAVSFADSKIAYANVNSEIMCARGCGYVEICVRLEVRLVTGLVRKFRFNPHPESVSVGGWMGQWCSLDCKWMKRWSSGESVNFFTMQ
jgi:hypothetical protein